MNQIDKILQEALVQNNVLTDIEVQAYWSEAQSRGESLRDFLLQRGVVTKKQMLISLSQNLHLETVDFSKAVIDPSVIGKVSVKFAWYYKFMPIRIEQSLLTIAVANPWDIKIQDEIRMHLGFDIKVVLADEADLLEAIKKYYGFASDMIDRILTKEPKTAQSSVSDLGEWIEDIEQSTENPTVSHLVNQIILEAYKKRATDIHIEPYRNRVRFRYRIDGVLIDANLADDVRHFMPQILSRIKILANLSITEKRLPQDGSAVVKTNDQHLDLRISTLPTPRGESMVIRILPTKVMHLSLEKLGFNSESIAKMRELIKRPHGIVFMTGPTGSGKTTTLYACLNEINSSKRKIITIEDPIEYEMAGITQIQVNPKLSFTFATGLRSILRHDPDIIMVGEVRDVETAEIAVRTAMTGHLVFSTLHTNDAASGINRLIDMGVEPYLVVSSVEAFVAQRLIRVICPQCKEEALDCLPAIKEEISKSLNLPERRSLKIYRGAGCDHCNRTGFYGRVAIYEILVLNDAIRTAILEKPRSDYIKKIAAQEGLISLRQNGWKAVLDGITTPEEVMNVTTKDDWAGRKTVVSGEDIPPEEYNQKVIKTKQGSSGCIKNEQNSFWITQKQYESRIYPRCFEPVSIQYRVVKPDPDNLQVMIVEDVEYSTTTEDISAGGLRFATKKIFPVDSILEIKIQLEKGQENISCLAKVCRLEKDQSENIYAVLTYYLDMSRTDRATINKYVERKLNKDGRVAIQGIV